MIIKLRSYLKTLEDNEKVRAEKKRRDVPSITALAKDVDISRVQLQRIASGDISSIKLEVADRIIKAMRERGFDMDVNDLLEYRE